MRVGAADDALGVNGGHNDGRLGRAEAGLVGPAASKGPLVRAVTGRLQRRSRCIGKGKRAETAEPRRAPKAWRELAQQGTGAERAEATWRRAAVRARNHGSLAVQRAAYQASSYTSLSSRCVSPSRFLKDAKRRGNRR